MCITPTGQRFRVQPSCTRTCGEPGPTFGTRIWRVRKTMTRAGMLPWHGTKRITPTPHPGSMERGTHRSRSTRWLVTGDSTPVHIHVHGSSWLKGRIVGILISQHPLQSTSNDSAVLARATNRHHARTALLQGARRCRRGSSKHPWKHTPGRRHDILPHVTRCHSSSTPLLRRDLLGTFPSVWANAHC